MKTLILSLIAAAALCLPAQAKERTVTERDSLGNTTRIIELLDTVRDGKAVTDTLSITTYDSPAKVTETCDSDDFFPIDKEDIKEWGENIIGITTLFVLGMFLFFITPIVLIILIFYFRNKNRKQRYLLMQQALAAGQPLPKKVFKEVALPDNRVKGIKNIALGLGLALFLWMLTGEFSIGCIGLLILCIGVGQVVIHYTTPRRPETPDAARTAQPDREQPAAEPTDNANTPAGQQ